MIKASLKRLFLLLPLIIPIQEILATEFLISDILSLQHMLVNIKDNDSIKFMYNTTLDLSNIESNRKTIEINRNNIVIQGNNSSLHQVYYYPALIISGSGCSVSNLEIFCDYNFSSNESGDHGIIISGNSMNVDGLYIHNVYASGILITGDDNVVINSTFDMCRWDGVTVFGSYDISSIASNNKINNCIAKSTGRHGFASDANTSGTVFNNCIVINHGNITLDEGHNAFHFEYANDCLINNCKVEINDLSSYNKQYSAPKSSELNIGARTYNSKYLQINGLIISISPDFIYYGTDQDFSWLTLENTNTEVNTCHLNNSVVNISSSLLSKGYLGKTNLYVDNCKFIGNISMEQNANGATIKRIANSFFQGVAYRTPNGLYWSDVGFYKVNHSSFGMYDSQNDQHSTHIEIKNNIFKNMKYVIYGGVIQKHYIYNNIFIDCFTSFGFLSDYNAISNENIIQFNHFSNLNHGFDADDYASIRIENNMFFGTFYMLMNSTSNNISWTNNKSGTYIYIFHPDPKHSLY